MKNSDHSFYENRGLEFKSIQRHRELYICNYKAETSQAAFLSSSFKPETEIRMSDRLHFVQRFITVSCTCSESNSSTKDLHADGLPREDTRPIGASVCRACEGNKSNDGAMNN